MEDRKKYTVIGYSSLDYLHVNTLMWVDRNSILSAWYAVFILRCGGYPHTAIVLSRDHAISQFVSKMKEVAS